MNSIMSKVRIIGDVHGKYAEFYNIASNGNLPIIQLGDFGYDYKILEHYHPDLLKIIFGNHEHHLERFKWPHFLNSYGEIEFNGLKFFYVGGAFSIDWQIRQSNYFGGHWPQTWWQEEQLSYDQLNAAYKLYEQIKPDLVITHEPIRTVAKIIGNDDFLRNWGFDPKTFTTRTGEALEEMFEIHKPSMWISGHMHKSWRRNVSGVDYISLAELEYLDI